MTRWPTADHFVSWTTLAPSSRAPISMPAASGLHTSSRLLLLARLLRRPRLFSALPFIGITSMIEVSSGA
jgi:hypothetical protein